SQILTSYDEIEEMNMDSSLTSLEGTLLLRGEILENIASNYAQMSEVRQFVQTKTNDSELDLFTINSLKSSGVTFVAIINQAGTVQYLKWYDPETYQEIPANASTWLFSCTQFEDNRSGPSILQYSQGNLLLISHAPLISPEERGGSAGILIIGGPFQPFIDMARAKYNLKDASVQINSSQAQTFFPRIFLINTDGSHTVTAHNETVIQGEITYRGYTPSTSVSITLMGEKKFFDKGRSFVTSYFWRSTIFALLCTIIGVMIMLILFREYDHAHSLMRKQEEEISRLRERREILDKFHIILDRYLHSGPDTDQNIALISAAAGSLFNAESVIYARIEGGMPVIVGSWPIPNQSIHDWIIHTVVSNHPYRGNLENTVLPLSQICTGKTEMITGANPSIQSILFRSIHPGNEILGYFFMFFRGLDTFNETNQIVLDLLVNALYSEESRRIEKNALYKRDIVLEAIGHSATHLLRDLSISSIVEILQTFVTQIGVHEAHIFIWNFNTEGEQILTHDYVWVDTHIKPTFEQLRWDDLISGPMSHWVSDRSTPIIRAGSPDMFQDQKEYLENRGIHSIVLIPLVSRNEYVGALFLVDRIQDRFWLPTELEALQIASGLIMATIVKIESDENLREREENFKHFFNQLRDFVFVLDTDGRIITSNLYAIQEIGVKPSDMKGMHLSGTFTTRWIDTPPPSRERPSSAGYIERSAILLTIDGKEIPVEIRQLPGIWNGNQAIFCICKDISALKRSEQKFATAFRSSQVLHIILNLRTDRIIDVNTTFCKTLDISRDDLIQSPSEFFSRICDSEQLERMKEVILTRGSIQDCEISLKTREEKVRQGSLYGALIEIEGEPCVLYSIVDITEKKRAEARIQRLLQELSDTNHDLNNFAHTVAHDLKDPLRGISSLVSWIIEDNCTDLDPDGKRYLQMIVGQVHRMSDLIDGILAYSRAGIVHEEQVIVPIEAIIKKVLEILSPPPSVTIRIENELPQLRGEWIKILQVFQNIISNALNHLNKEGGEILIRSRPYGESWVFEISDNGIGIDPSLHGSIFEVFRSFSSPRGKKGTGIGLSIVKRIVESSGGSVWVESEPGVGSTFFFTFTSPGEFPDICKPGVSS
ncbi:MAG TPA: ATP-binding protein, partial [Methanospirillum sp.]|nr:ATP-binding protein [Methanospirillum sp.]